MQPEVTLEADTDTHPSFPAIQRYRNAIARHAKFPSRPTAEILALHEASIDTFVAERREVLGLLLPVGSLLEPAS